MVYSIINEEPLPVSVLNEDVSAELEKIVNKCLVKDPDERYSTIDDLLADFKGFSKELNISFDESLPKLLSRLWRKKIVRQITTAVTATLLLILGWFLFWPQVTEPTPIAVISFENQTGDPKYDMLSKVVPNFLITNLEQSGQFQVVTWERLNDLKRQLGKDSVEFIDSDLGFQLCQMEGVPNIAVGTIARIGDIFSTDLKILDVESKEIRQTAQSRGEGDQSIYDQIDELTKEIATGIGGMTEEKFTESHRSIMDVTTSSMEAYNYFLRGREEFERNYYVEARKFLERAVELDSTFAIAHLYLGLIFIDWSKGIERQEALKQLEKAYKFRENSSEKERLYIESEYVLYEEEGKSSDKEIHEEQLRLREQLVEKYPREKRFSFNLGDSYIGFWMNEKAIAELERAIKLDPDYASPYIYLGILYNRLGNTDKAIESFNQYISIYPGDARPYDAMGNIYFYKGDFEQAKVKYREALYVQPGYDSGWRLAYTYALEQNYDEAIRVINDYIEANRGNEHIQKGVGYLYRAIYHIHQGNLNLLLDDLNEDKKINTDIISIQIRKWIEGWYYYDKGDIERSKKAFQISIDTLDKIKDPTRKLKTKIRINFSFGMLELKQGNIDSAKSRLKFIEANLENLDDSFSKSAIAYWSQFFLIELLLAENNLDSALTACRKLKPYPNWLSHWYSFYPYVRDIKARTYLQSGEIDTSIVEYEKLITFDPTTWDFHLIHPKYHYRLASIENS
jgi:tetratricopeptide (TPR) repeat protein